MIELTITAVNHAAEGIGRHEGRATFVPFALPGEVVRVEIVEARRNFARARLVEVVTASPDRGAPLCRHHFTLEQPDVPACGGCHLQHASYSAQLRLKADIVRDQLTRIGGFADPPVRPALAAPAPFGYRNHARFGLTADGRLGFHAAQSDQIIPIDDCPILAPSLAELKGRVSVDANAGVQAVTLRAGLDDALVALEGEAAEPEVEIDLPVPTAWLRADGSSLALAGRDYLVESVRGREFQISAGSFFQVNSLMAEQLVDLVLGALRLQGGETVLDLYCGVGLFTAFIAPAAGRVIGIEASAAAVADLAHNLDEFDNVEIYEAEAESVLPGLDVRPQAVVLDPPRAGCAVAVIDALAALRAPRLVYVSCDPATLARDAKRLCAHGYALAWVQPLDLFPQTHHVECVTLFEWPIEPAEGGPRLTGEMR